MGSTLSVLDFVSVGATLSLRSFSRFGSSLSISGTLLASGSVYFTAPDLEIRALSTPSPAAYTRRISFGESGRVLHGDWEAESPGVAASDRRLKTSITPLHHTLLAHMARLTGKSFDSIGSSTVASASASAQAGTGGSSGERVKKAKSRQDAVDWMLRELRPVSFNFREGT